MTAPAPGVRELRASHHNDRHYIWGSIWPRGREHARDEAQIRIFERAVIKIAETKTKKENAA